MAEALADEISRHRGDCVIYPDLRGAVIRVRSFMRLTRSRDSPDRLQSSYARRRMSWRAWRVGAMRRSKRLQAMARFSRSMRRLAARVWRAAPWLLLGALLLATSVLTPAALSQDIDRIPRWVAVACAIIAPFAALLFEPPRRQQPSQSLTLVVHLAVMALVAYAATRIVIPQANNFYSVRLLMDGALLLYVLNAAQSAMRRVSPVPTTAAPRAADALMDGVRVLLILFFISAAILWRPVAALTLALALAFAVLALLFRSPGAVAHLARTRS